MTENSTPPKKGGDAAKIKRPQQERGILRYNALLDAVHELLLDHEVENIGLYAIAEKAGVPPASAYHFFPTPIAALLAMADRYRQRFSELTQDLDMPDDGRWQTLLRQRVVAAARAYNEMPSMQKLLLGARTTRELAQSEARFDEQMARQLVESFDLYFHMPVIREAERKCLVMLTLVDAVWRLSYANHKTITPEFEEESVLVAVSYSRTFLPEVLEKRIASDLA